MNKENIELYDRNIRLWGKDTQIKIFNSKILLLGFTPSLTEAAKNLVLAGNNLLFFDDGSTVQSEDVKLNFFLGPDAVGKNKAETLKGVFTEMNSLVAIDLVDPHGLFHSKPTFNSACVDINYWSEKLENFFIQHKIITYWVFSSGYYGFFVNNIKNDHQEKEEIEEVFELDEGEEEKNAKDDAIVLEDSDEEKEKEAENKEQDFNYEFVAMKEKFVELLNHVPERRKEISKYVAQYSFAVHFLKDPKLLESELMRDIQKEVKNLSDKFESKEHFFPLECVIGGLVSQELINSIAGKEKVNAGIYGYDGINQVGEYNK